MSCVIIESSLVVKNKVILSEKSINHFVGGDATVENSDLSFQELVEAGETLVLEDYDFELQDPNGAIISNTIEPAMTDQDFIVGASGLCPTVFDYNLKVNGKFKEVAQVDIFANINITLK